MSALRGKGGGAPSDQQVQSTASPPAPKIGESHRRTGTADKRGAPAPSNRVMPDLDRCPTTWTHGITPFNHECGLPEGHNGPHICHCPNILPVAPRGRGHHH